MTTRQHIPRSSELSRESLEMAREFTGIDRVPTVAQHRAELADLEAGINADLGVQPVVPEAAKPRFIDRPLVRRVGTYAAIAAGAGLVFGAVAHGIDKDPITQKFKATTTTEQPEQGR